MKNYLAKFLRNENIGRKCLINEIRYSQRIKVKDTEYIDELERRGISVISFDEDIYPECLKEISDFPVLLFAKGDRKLLDMNLITLVGTRSMSKYGKKVVNNLVPSAENICFVSGLARGIDGEVHKTCLENNIPTIAITAGGIGEGFPKSNTELFNKICEQGLIISEFPPGRAIIKGMFPMRNRILAGISKASVIIESGIKGGSMITADLALEYGREVMALPGDIFSTSSDGCNSLISQGATIVTNKEHFNVLLNDCIHR